MESGEHEPSTLDVKRGRSIGRGFMDDCKVFLNDKDIKLAEFNMLKKLVAFCDGNGLHYSFAGGSMLGAVRHQGFIPWDDDIDVSMPRPDYERLLRMSAAFRDETGLNLSGYQEIPLHLSPFCKVTNPCIRAKAANELAEGFLWIDVFPVDALPDDDVATRLIYRKAGMLQRALMLLVSEPSSGGTPLRRLAKRLLSPLANLQGLKTQIGKQLTDLATSLSYDQTNQVGIVTWGLYGEGERISKSGYEKRVEVNFEGQTFLSMSCWHEYLSGLYGDYMTLPPEDKRIIHGLTAWRLDD